MVVLEFSITPLGVGESVGQYVARAVDIIDRCGLNYQLHAMGTNVEGELDQCSTCCSSASRPWRSTAIESACRPSSTIEKATAACLAAKPAAIEKRLGRTLKK